MCLAAFLAAGAATPSDAQVPDDDPDRLEPTRIYQLGIPLNAVPPAGKCRIWRPGNRLSYQPGVGRCDKLEKQVPPDAWLLRHPEPAEGERDRVILVVYAGDEPSLVRVFGTEDGILLRERMVGDEGDVMEVAASGGPHDSGKKKEKLPAEQGDRGEEAAPEKEPEADDREEAGRRYPERVRRARAAVRDGNTLYALEIPRSAQPAEGRCRIWRPGRTVERQPPPGPCDRVRAAARPGVWVLHHRGGADGGRIELSVWAEDGPVLTRVFDAEDGTLVREESPGR